MSDWVFHICEGVRGDKGGIGVGGVCVWGGWSSPSHHPWDRRTHSQRTRTPSGGNAIPRRRHLSIYSRESHRSSRMLSVFLIDGAEIHSLWYMHRAGPSDRTGVEGSGVKRAPEHYQSIFHRCQQGLVPVSSSGCHLLNEGMKGMFKAEIQACSDKGLHMVTRVQIAYETLLQGDSIRYMHVQVLQDRVFFCISICNGDNL